MKWILAGASNIAKEWVIDAIREVEDEIICLVSSSEERGKLLTQQYDIPFYATSLESALKRHDVDAVYISTTNEKHFPQSVIALIHGKHVMCEKPIALNMPDAEQMITLAEAEGKVLGVNHHLRNSEIIIKMRKMILSGTLGQISAVRVCHAVALPEHLQGWRVSDEVGGGVVLDITVHDIDTLRFLLDDEPAEINAITQTGILSSSGGDETVMGTVRFTKGTLVSFYDSFTANYFETSIDVIGTEGCLRAVDVLTQQAKGTLYLHNKYGISPVEVQHKNLYVNSFSAFKRAVLNGDKPAADGRDGLKSLLGALIVSQSVKEGKQVLVP